MHCASCRNFHEVGKFVWLSAIPHGGLATAGHPVILFLGCGWSERMLASRLYVANPGMIHLPLTERYVPPIGKGPLAGPSSVEDIWRLFFIDPSQWWDNSIDKVNPRYPDFKHKRTGLVLWIDSKSNPSWVKAKLESLRLGCVTRSLYSWNALLSKCVKSGRGQEALDLFKSMQANELKPDSFTFARVLNACATLEALDEGRSVHAQVIQSGCAADVFVGNTLIDMYVKCGSIDDAWGVFQNMPSRSVVSWTAMLSGFLKWEEARKALELFGRMQAEGVKPDAVAFVVVLNACAKLVALKDGKHVHWQILENGFQADLVLGNTLVDMYAKCGSIDDAWSVFHGMPKRDVVSWNVILAGCVKCDESQKALQLFGQMHAEAVKPNHITFVAVLNACASLLALEDGRRVHAQLIQSGFGCQVTVGNSLVDMYAKCGAMDDAWDVFNGMPTRDVISWNVMVAGCVRSEEPRKALHLFGQMQAQGVNADPVTFIGILNACASLMALEEGRDVHTKIIQSGCSSDLFVGSTLVDMYGKCRSIGDAWTVFHRMSTRDVVAWNAMIGGCVKCEEGQKALGLLAWMQAEGVEPNPATFVAILNACANSMALEGGRRVHMQVLQRGWESEVFVGSTLVNMYAKCGSLGDAWTVFRRLQTRDVACWNAMLGGLAMHGHGSEAVQLFEEMWQECVEIDVITFVGLLSACSHAGLVQEGISYFQSMSSVYGVPRTVQHYACVVDLLSRAGHLDEAEEIILSDPEVREDSVVLMALLGACRSHGNIEMGKRIAQKVIELDPHNVSAYVLLSNMYAAAGQWDSRDKVQQLRKERSVKKVPNRTWIEVNNQVHSFIVDDQVHSQIVQIHAELDRLSVPMEKAGYVPDSQFGLHDADEEENVLRLCLHSEKLALAFGLMSTAPGTPLRIFKNLTVCGDCHTYTKLLANIEEREIVVRDSNRFHHFKDGVCSCRDYW